MYRILIVLLCIPLITGLHNQDLSPRTDKIEDYYDILATTFYQSCNYPMALKYFKKAYKPSLRSLPPAIQARLKQYLKIAKDMMAKEPPLRFAVGDEVEFLHENSSKDSVGKWMIGKIVELYYRERDFEISFTAPYRIQLLDQGSSDANPVHVWVKADIDRYVRKICTRSLEDTRYQAQLDAKIDELAHVYCSEEFILDIYHSLKCDEEFCGMLLAVWHIELSRRVLYFYRMLVMYRQPLIPTDSGYHVPSSEEVIAGIKSFFNPCDAALASYSAISDESLSSSMRVKAIVVNLIQSTSLNGQYIVYMYKFETVEAIYLRFICSYPLIFYPEGPATMRYMSAPKDQPFIENYLGLELPSDCLTPAVTSALSKAPSSYALKDIIPDPKYTTIQRQFLTVWKIVLTYIESAKSGPACDCPWIYFFVKTRIDQGAGVPKPALAVYKRMKMQLSKEFIRCAYPTCERNRLDQSGAEVKFKKCSRCQVAIYCSRECQVAHYPVHKAHFLQQAKL